jgi:hypothetical protein
MPFGTMLSKGGVAPRTAQAAIRHSEIKLTMDVYTDPKLLDVHGALDALPSLPLDAGRTASGDTAKATVTIGKSRSQFARQFDGKPYKPMQTKSGCDNRLSPGTGDSQGKGIAVSSNADKKEPPTTPVSGSSSRGDRTPLELFLVGIRTLTSQLSIKTKALVAILDSTCSELPALK